MTGSKKATGKEAGPSALATNRRARHEYEVLESIEAGIELRGTEIKAARQNLISLQEGFASINAGQAWLEGVTIQPYSHGNVHNHDPRRPRRLLLHKNEVLRLFSKTQLKGYTLIPLKAYLKRGRMKIELGLCRGKQLHDKRETIKRRDADREADRAMSRARKG